jgi:uncharacterized membrane protein
MNKQTFMRELTEGLNKLPKAEVNDILLDIEEYFTCAAREGRTEQEMCERLGDPKKLAKEYSVQRYIERAQQEHSVKNTARAILSTAGLGIIDFLYVVFVVVTGYIVLSALYVAACSIGLAGFAGVGFCIAYFGTVGMFAGWAGIFGGGFLTALGVLGFIGLMQLGKLFRKGNMLFLSSISERIKGGKNNE